MGQLSRSPVLSVPDALYVGQREVACAGCIALATPSGAWPQCKTKAVADGRGIALNRAYGTIHRVH